MINRLMFDHVLRSPDRRPIGLGVGLVLGLIGGTLALILVMVGPLMTFAGLFAIGVGLIALSNLDAALIVLLATVGLLPFGTLPFKIAITPSLIDIALATVIIVYLFQWMTGRRYQLQSTPVHIVIIIFILIMLGAFIRGLANAPLTPTILRRFVGLMGNIVLALIIVDIVRTKISLRRMVATFMIIGAIASAIGIVLWFLDDFTAETILNRLGRIGYPVGGVIRVREDGVQILRERAIGTWVDPNAFGGFLMMVGALTAPQLLSRRPVIPQRWIMLGLFSLIAFALFLSDSRGSMLGLIVGIGFVALLRYRKLIWVMIAIGVISLFLPPTQEFINRLIAGFTGADLETQMRFGEYKDAFRLIARYPTLGVGFSAPPDIDLYLGFASTYLTITANAGIIGLMAYLTTFTSIFSYAYRNRADITSDDDISDIWYGLMAGIVGALFSSIFDHFYFNVEFQATSLVVWLYVGLFLAATRIAVPDDAKTYGGVSIPIFTRKDSNTPTVAEDLVATS